jgi:PAS domain S-box-containing protein
MEPGGDDSGGQSFDLEQRFFDLSLDMLAVLGFDGHFKRLNHAWQSTLGFTPAEMMERPFIDFVHPDDRERTLSQNRDVRGGGRAHLFENRYVCKDGSYRWMLWNARPDPDHRLIYAVARDMTARKLADGEREELVRELREALAEVRVLQSFLPICSYCKRIRNDQNYWQSVEGYISAHTNTQFSHSICPECYDTRVDPAFKEGL